MTASRYRWRSVFLLMLVASVQSGCNQSEIERLRNQLTQADKRLEIATTQVEAANAQLLSLKDSLEQSRHETAKIKQEAVVQRQQSEQEMVAIQATLSSTRRALAATQAKLDEIARENEKANQVISALGVWELVFKDTAYRFSFNDDGQVVVNCKRSSDFDWKPPKITSQPSFDRLEDTYSFRHIEANKFALADASPATNPKSTHTGRLLVHSKNTASIWFDHDGNHNFRDEFGKPKWLKLTKVREASAPQDDSR